MGKKGKTLKFHYMKPYMKVGRTTIYGQFKLVFRSIPSVKKMLSHFIIINSWPIPTLNKNNKAAAATASINK